MKTYEGNELKQDLKERQKRNDEENKKLENKEQ